MVADILNEALAEQGLADMPTDDPSFDRVLRKRMERAKRKGLLVEAPDPDDED